MKRLGIMKGLQGFIGFKTAFRVYEGFVGFLKGL